MQLLIQRNQKEIMSRVVFTLWAKFELKEEEIALIDRYKMRRAIITEGNTARDLRKLAIYAFFLAWITIMVVYAFPVPSLMLSFIVGILSFPLWTYAIYNKIREQIKVDDILDGRSFRCSNMVVLFEKEQHLTKTAGMFRRFLEEMKTWGGREVIDIEPYTPPSSRIIEMPHAAE